MRKLEEVHEERPLLSRTGSFSQNGPLCEAVDQESAVLSHAHRFEETLLVLETSYVKKLI